MRPTHDKCRRLPVNAEDICVYVLILSLLKVCLCKTLKPTHTEPLFQKFIVKTLIKSINL